MSRDFNDPPGTYKRKGNRKNDAPGCSWFLIGLVGLVALVWK